MKVALAAFVAGTLILVALQNAQAQKAVEVSQSAWPPKRIEVTYELQFNANCSTDTPPPPLKITTNRQATGQDIMEIAANENSSYRFSADYYSTELGYFVTKIAGVENNSVTKCYWLLFVGTEFGVSQSPVGVSNWYPFPGSKMIWRYTRTLPH